MKEITDKLPPEVSESESFTNMHAQIESLLETIGTQASQDISAIHSELTNEEQNHSDKTSISTEVQDMSQNVDGTPTEMNGASVSYAQGTTQSSTENGSAAPEVAKAEGHKEIIEQFEPGVYVTLIQLGNGTKIFKRVRFRYFLTFPCHLNFYTS